MSNRSRDESEMAERIKKLDFSRFSSVHKDNLWEALEVRNTAHQLSDDKLDFVSAAGENGAQAWYNVCPTCGAKPGATQGSWIQCDSCGAYWNPQ